MALLDFLKKKKEAEKSSASAKASADKKKPVENKNQKASVTKEPKKAEIKKEAAPVKATVDKGSFSYNVIKEPHISEKATNLASVNNKYTFKVYGSTNKPEIKKSVEGIYGVDVLAVNIIKIPHKKRRLGKTQGFKKAFTKAVVQIKEGQKIELF